jgi:hypothetical protein
LRQLFFIRRILVDGLPQVSQVLFENRLFGFELKLLV